MTPHEALLVLIGELRAQLSQQAAENEQLKEALAEALKGGQHAADVA